MLGLLLARAGVQVTVLEKHGDFLRDFRGDTVHASTLTVLDELGLGEEFTALPTVRYIESLTAQLDAGEVPVSDLRWLPGRHKHIALVPQWDFLGLVAEAGRREPAYDLVMNAEVTELLREQERVVGVRYRHDGVDHDLIADLVVACDGRDSTVASAAGLTPRQFGTPMDVEWFRLPRREHDPANALGRLTRDAVLVLIDRGDYFQIGYLIKKGTDRVLRDAGIGAFRSRIALALPWLADRVETLTSFEDVKLLTVRLSRAAPLVRRRTADHRRRRPRHVTGGWGRHQSGHPGCPGRRPYRRAEAGEQDPHARHLAARSTTTMGTDGTDPGSPAGRSPRAPSTAIQRRHRTSRRYEPSPPRTAAAAIPAPTGDPGTPRGPRRAPRACPTLGHVPGLQDPLISNGP